MIEEKIALIIVDVQNDFCEGGALAVNRGTMVAEEIASYVSLMHNEYDLIVTTQDWHIDPGEHFETWPVHCVANSEGADFHPNLKPALKYVNASFLKGQWDDGYSGFANTKLDSYLQENHISDVDVVGIAFDHCVRATALDAADLDYRVTVLPNLCAAVDKDSSVWETVNDLVDAGVELK